MNTGPRQTSRWECCVSLAKAGIEPSVGSVGDACDYALAETINGLYKTEVIRRRKSWRTMDEVKIETLKWPYGDASIAYRLERTRVQSESD